MFPGTLETDSLRLTRLCHANVDVFELYDRFAAGSDGAADVFEYVPQDPYATPNDARDRLEAAESE